MMKDSTIKLFNLSLAAIILFFALILSACQGGVLGLGGGDQSASPNIVFQDDFSNPVNAWDMVKDDGGSVDYFEGALRILVNSNVNPTQGGRVFYLSTPKQFYNDINTEVDVTKVSGIEKNVFGTICGYQDVNNFFAFFINSDGYYGIAKVVDGAPPQYIGKAKDTGKMASSDVIKKGNASNHIRTDCMGTKLTLYVNGQMLDSADDPDLAAGDIGLLAGAFGEGGLDVRFDNLKVLMP